MAALRCSQCAIDWPYQMAIFARCPVCLEPTEPIGGGEPLEWDVAVSIKRHQDFDRFYDAREAKKA